MIESAQKQFVLIGCYTDPNNSKGLHLFEFNSADKMLNLLSSIETPNASYIDISPDRGDVYVVNENHTNLDTVTALKCDLSAQELKIVNTVSSQGSDPCFISLGSNNKHLFVSNYSDGSLCVIPIDTQGALNDNSQVIRHALAINDKEHSNSHMHSAFLCPDGKFLLALNLGLDTITVYRYHSERYDSPLDPEPFFTYNFPAGTGPRHALFSNEGKYLYVVGELDASIHVLSWAQGKLIPKQQMLLMGSEYKAENSAADLHFSKDNRFLYVSNRGSANQIIVFENEATSGNLVRLTRIDTNGNGPRNFAIDPTGKFLLVAHQKSNDIRIFEIDPSSGIPLDTGKVVALNSPVCIKFL